MHAEWWKQLQQESFKNELEELFNDEDDDDDDDDEHDRLTRRDSPEDGDSSQQAEPFWTTNLARQLLAEAVGTFIIVQVGTAAVMSAVFADALKGLFQIASVWIIAVTIAIATTGPISGAHLNPAISISLSVLRPSPSFGVVKLGLYIVSQTVGASIGSLVNLLMYNKKIIIFEAANNITRGSPESVKSAMAFGEYFQ
jgi:glycerol uptake facilitator-like aquaporin